MAITYNDEVEIYYELFGDASKPTLLLINGLGSQCINFDADWCELFTAEGFQVVRFDNRDTGLSSKLDGEKYDLMDMAADALAVLDAIGVEQAHVMGLSLGGMIAQRLAIDNADRLLTLTSAMSTTGEADVGQASPEALKVLLAHAPKNRSEYIDLYLTGAEVFGSRPEWIDPEALRALYGHAFDRSFCPQGVGRQMGAVMADGSRAEELRNVKVPTLVLHGDRDKLIDPSGGRRTAELISGARYVEIEGLGHDYPRAAWPQWVAIWAEFVRESGDLARDDVPV